MIDIMGIESQRWVNKIGAKSTLLNSARPIEFKLQTEMSMLNLMMICKPAYALTFQPVDSGGLFKFEHFSTNSNVCLLYRRRIRFQF